MSDGRTPMGIGGIPLIDELDQLRAHLDDLAKALPLGDVQMLLLSAKDKIGMAQDLFEAEYLSLLPKVDSATADR